MILDAKRGDIGSTSEAYADTYLSPGSPLESDALTLQPYLGLDALEPFVARAESFGRGVFVLVRTSNAGARDFQDQSVGGQRLFLRVAERLAETEQRLAGDSGWSSLGVVAGATYPEDARALRALLPRSLFLVPGYGAQGGSAADAVHGFVPGRQCRRGAPRVGAPHRCRSFPGGVGTGRSGSPGLIVPAVFSSR